MKSGSRSDGLMSEINVTPFVDVMLVLLIIFMVTAPMMTQGVDVTLPQATAEPLPTDTEPLIITLDDQQRLYILDFEVNLEFFSDKLQKVLESRDKREVFLRAGKDVPYGAVVQVMAAIKAAGVEKIGMVTDPLDQTTPIVKSKEKAAKQG
jgi:biopolymer transport protein TolR